MATAPKLEEGMRIDGEYFILVKKVSPRVSASQKSILLATTNGREEFDHEGKPVQVNLNVYVPNPKYKKK